MFLSARGFSASLLSACLWLMINAAHAEQWVEAGQSSVGKHYVDPSSVTRNPELQQVSVMTRVDEANGGRWLTSMLIECQQHRFSYQHGYHLDAAGKQSFKFDAPRASEPITQPRCQINYSSSIAAGWGKARIAHYSPVNPNSANHCPANPSHTNRNGNW